MMLKGLSFQQVGALFSLSSLSVYWESGCLPKSDCHRVTNTAIDPFDYIAIHNHITLAHGVHCKYERTPALELTVTVNLAPRRSLQLTSLSIFLREVVPEGLTSYYSISDYC
jgi:hypothetical protein